MSEYHERIYQYDSSEIRKQIEGSKLFSLDKEQEPVAYAREAYKMVENLVKYMFAINEVENVNFGVEIAELADRCIKAYDPSVNTPFLTYYLSSWRTEYRRLKGKQIKDELLKGIHVNKKLMDKVLKYVRYANSIGKEYQSDDFIQLISDETDRPINEIREYIALIEQGVTTNEIESNDGNLINLFESFSETRSIEEKLEEIETIKQWGRRIEEEFIRLQDRKKPYISCMLTMKLVHDDGINEQIIDAIRDMSFFDNETYLRMISNEKITARVIADEFGTSEQNISRGYKTFISNMRNK